MFFLQYIVMKHTNITTLVKHMINLGIPTIFTYSVCQLALLIFYHE